MKTKSDSSFVPYALRPTPYALRRGFTLVELLVTITIIAMVAGMSFGALQWARRAAAEEKTRQTIAKLNSVIMRKYESYRTRRVPIRISTTVGDPTYIAPNDPLYARKAASFRLTALRDLMRMEMPDTWLDVKQTTSSSDPTPKIYPVLAPGLSASASLNRFFTYYQTAYNRLTSPPLNKTGADAKNTLSSHDSAKCLYMLVSLTAPDELAHFRPDEIADYDGDGCKVFVDGWGEPIYFMRWAPGFFSDLQPNTTTRDPFDPNYVDAQSWKLVPLLYSGGPDKRPGLTAAPTGSPAPTAFVVLVNDSTLNIQCIQSCSRTWQGAPQTDADNLNKYLDNITNHDTSAAR